MDLEELERLDYRDGDWELKSREWRATHNQIGRAMKWMTKPVKEELENDHLIMAEVKMKMAMMRKENETIEDLRHKPTAMVKNFEAKTPKRFRGGNQYHIQIWLEATMQSGEGKGCGERRTR